MPKPTRDELLARIAELEKANESQSRANDFDEDWRLLTIAADQIGDAAAQGDEGALMLVHYFSALAVAFAARLTVRGE